jgi:hypothetical protein
LNKDKFQEAGKCYNNFIVVTEDELIDEDKFFQKIIDECNND